LLFPHLLIFPSSQLLSFPLSDFPRLPSALCPMPHALCALPTFSPSHLLNFFLSRLLIFPSFFLRLATDTHRQTQTRDIGHDYMHILKKKERITVFHAHFYTLI
jgi:hypothetical protein